MRACVCVCGLVCASACVSVCVCKRVPACAWVSLKRPNNRWTQAVAPGGLCCSCLHAFSFTAVCAQCSTQPTVTRMTIPNACTRSRQRARDGGQRAQPRTGHRARARRSRRARRRTSRRQRRSASCKRRRPRRPTAPSRCAAGPPPDRRWRGELADGPMALRWGALCSPKDRAAVGCTQRQCRVSAAGWDAVRPQGLQPQVRRRDVPLPRVRAPSGSAGLSRGEQVLVCPGRSRCTVTRAARASHGADACSDRPCRRRDRGPRSRCGVRAARRAAPRRHRCRLRVRRRSCCPRKKFSDFNDFLSAPGCTVGTCWSHPSPGRAGAGAGPVPVLCRASAGPVRRALYDSALRLRTG